MMNIQEFEEKIQNTDLKKIPKSYWKALHLLNNPWNMTVLFTLLALGKATRTEIRAKIPMLTNTTLRKVLEELNVNDLVSYYRNKEDSNEDRFGLSEKGKQLLPIFYDIYVWSQQEA